MSSAAEFKDQGNKYLQAKEFDKAIEAYSNAIALNPNDHIYFSNRSAAYLSKGDAQNALTDAEQCIKLNPSWAKGYSRKGAALHALRKYEDALNTYEAGLKVAPNDQGLKDNVAEINKILSSSQTPWTYGNNSLLNNQMLAKLAAHPKYKNKITDPAFIAKLQNIQSDPNILLSDPEMMEVFQIMLEGMQPPKEEEYNSIMKERELEEERLKKKKAEEEALKKKKVEEEYYNSLSQEEKDALNLRNESNKIKDEGNTLYKSKKFEEAIAKYEQALEIDKTNLMVNNNKAAVLIELGKFDEATATCEKIIETATANGIKLSFEDKAKIYQRLASIALKSNNDIEKAIELYKKAQMENHDKLVEKKIKNYELELKKLKQQQYINPELGLEAKERGNTYFREGNFPKAIEEYEEAIKRDPKNSSYHNNLAAAYQKMGLFNDAKREVDKSIELDPKYVKAWAKKGDIEFYMKEYHKAMDSYKHGLSLDENNTLCKQGLQKTLMKIQEANYSGEVDKERSAHAMADPEIQQILMDPTIRQILQDFQTNPKFANEAYQNDASIRAKIDKLIAAGVIQTR